MINRIVAMFAALSLLAGCVSADKRAPAAWPRLPENATPHLYCIFALNGEQAWVGGDFSDPAVTLHSMMYRTSDGGISWQRVGPAIPGSTVFTMHFIDSRTGWVAGAWTTESAGNPFVLRTTDGGQSWTRSDLPMTARPTPLFVPQSVEFVSPKHGIVRAAACVVADEQSVFVTQDGGKTWTFSHGRHEQFGPCNPLSVTRDGVLWKLDGRGVVSVSTDDGMSWRQCQGQPVTSSELDIP